VFSKKTGILENERYFWAQLFLFDIFEYFKDETENITTNGLMMMSNDV